MRIRNIRPARVDEPRYHKKLDARMPRDVGLAAADLEREAAKPFWRA
jgi:hypothetical protein